MRNRYTNWVFALIACTVFALASTFASAQAYNDAPGGWGYKYDANEPNIYGSGPGAFDWLDGSWNNGVINSGLGIDSSGNAWDGSGLGGTFAPGNAPGGVEFGSEAGVTYLRLQDPGNPEPYVYGSSYNGNSSAANGNVCFGRYFTNFTRAPLDSGMTLYFRVRVPTNGLDKICNGQSLWPYPERGDGYASHNNGVGQITLRNGNVNPNDWNDRTEKPGLIYFSLFPDESTNRFGTAQFPGNAGWPTNALDGLLLNNLFTDALNNQVDWNEIWNGANPRYQAGWGYAVENILPVNNANAWNEFWINIVANDATFSNGTHTVTIWQNGSATCSTFNVTGGDSTQEGYCGPYPSVQLGMARGSAVGNAGYTASGALDVDFIAVKDGLYAPPPGITTPPSSASRNVGESVQFTVVAGAAPTGTTLTGYQWRKNGVALADDSRISGATTATLTISDCASADAGNYSVMVSNSIGGYALSPEAVLTVTSPSVPTVTYYVDPNGNDGNHGTNQATPWKTLTKVNNTTFQPGNQILFKAGGTWIGQLWPKGSGNSSAQIALGAYGSGPKPIIDAQGAAGSAAIRLYNQEYWTIQGLEVVNWATTYGTRFGIRVHANDGQIKHRIRILNNTVRDVYASLSWDAGADYPAFHAVGGIYIAIAEPGRGDDLLIQGNLVTNIVGTGLSFWGENEWTGGGMNWSNLTPGVVLRSNTVSYTAGDGILILGTDDELVEYNHVGYAGALGNWDTRGVAGMWPTRHRDGLWQFNEVHHTKRWVHDGQGFNNDCETQGTTVFQYNYSHDNEGGFMLDCISTPDDGRSILRYSISVNETVGDLSRGNAEFYNNVFYSPSRLIRLVESSYNNKFYNNVFWCTNLVGFSAQILSHNTYFGGVVKPSHDAGGMAGDPKFVNPNSTGVLDGFKLQTGSPCLVTGLLITNNGGRDFWGYPVSETDPPNRGVDGVPGDHYVPIPATIQLAGPPLIRIPGAGTTNATYTATVRDQYDLIMTAITSQWSLQPSVPGIDMDPATGILSVSDTASPQTVSVIAQAGSLTGSLSVIIAPLDYLQIPTAIQVAGPLSIRIPSTGIACATYTATVWDQYGLIITGTTNQWSLQTSVTGITMDPATGVLSVSNTASPQTVSVIAQAGSITDSVPVMITPPAVEITVNTTDNTDFSAGKTNLVTAIRIANSKVETATTIKFNIPGDGPHHLITPPLYAPGGLLALGGGYPIITNHHVTIDGYSQPGALANTNTILGSNTAKLMIVIDSRQANYNPGGDYPVAVGGETMALRLITGKTYGTAEHGWTQYGDAAAAQIGVYNATNITLKGLCFLNDWYSGTDGLSLSSIALAADYPYANPDLYLHIFPDYNLHVAGCWFNLMPDGTTVVDGGQNAITVLRHKMSSANSYNYGRWSPSAVTVGVAKDSVNPRAEFNIFMSQAQQVVLQGERNRYCGNFFNVFASGMTQYLPDPQRYAGSPDGIHVPTSAFIGGNYAGRNVIGTDGDGVNDAEERNVMAGLPRKRANGCAQIDHQCGCYNVKVAGNYIGIAVDGITRWTNSCTAFRFSNRPDTPTNCVFGTEFDGVSDDLEGNVIANNWPLDYWFDNRENQPWLDQYPFHQLSPMYQNGAPPETLNTDKQVGALDHSFRGNKLINNFTAPMSPFACWRDADSAPGYFPSYMNVITYSAFTAPMGTAEEGATNFIAVLDPSSTTGQLKGKFPLGIGERTNVIIDVYAANEEGLTNGVKFPTLTNVLPVWAQGERVLAYNLLADAAGDLDPAAGSFEFDISAYNIPAGTKVTATASYAKAGVVGTYMAPMTTSRFSLPVSLIQAASPITIASITKSGNNVVIAWTGGSAPYVVEQRTSLSSGSWVAISTNMTPTATVAMGSQAFYRVR